MNTININLTFRSIEEIFTNSTLLINFWIIQYVVLWVSLVLLIVFVLYVNPTIAFILDHFKLEKQKRIKKQALKQILIQKELEDEMLKEVENH